MISTQTIVADAQGDRDLGRSMEIAITGYLKARDQLLLSIDAPDAYIYATNVLYVAFATDIGIADRRVMCWAFQAFRKALIHQYGANQAAIHTTDFQ